MINDYCTDLCTCLVFTNYNESSTNITLISPITPYRCSCRDFAECRFKMTITYNVASYF